MSRSLSEGEIATIGPCYYMRIYSYIARVRQMIDTIWYAKRPLLLELSSNLTNIRHVGDPSKSAQSLLCPIFSNQVTNMIQELGMEELLIKRILIAANRVLNMNLELLAVLKLNSNKRLMLTDLVITCNIDLLAEFNDSLVLHSLISELSWGSFTEKECNGGCVIDAELALQACLGLGIISQKQNAGVSTGCDVGDLGEVETVIHCLVVDLDPAIDGSVDDPIAGVWLECVPGDLPNLAKGGDLSSQILTSADNMRPAPLSFQAFKRSAKAILSE